ncbi:MAG: SAM-dependent methyltransferase, partial [Microthrixaceae bacterium]
EFDRDAPSPTAVAEQLGGGRVEVVPVPADCIDGFCHAWWRRPEAYLDPHVRAGISVIARLPEDEVRAGMARLARDLENGAWQDRHADLRDLDEIDAGYRLVVAPG